MAVRHETSTNPPRQFLLVFDVAGKTQLQRLTSDNLGTHGCNIYQIRIGGPGGITHRAGRGHRYYAAAGFGSRRGHPLCNRRLAHICDRYFFRRCRCIREKGDFQHSNWNVDGNCDDPRSRPWCVFGAPYPDKPPRRRVMALFRHREQDRETSCSQSEFLNWRFACKYSSDNGSC
jgi:hypothetical protein